MRIPWEIILYALPVLIVIGSIMSVTGRENWDNDIKWKKIIYHTFRYAVNAFLTGVALSLVLFLLFNIF